MAIEEQPREDLMREATAYAQRMLVRVLGISEPLFFGVRPDGGWSIYVGEDPAFQFNAKNEMRRAFVANEKFMADDGRLLVVKRQSRGGRVELCREHDLAAEQVVLESCRVVYQAVSDAAQATPIGIIAQATVPADDDTLVALMLKKLQYIGDQLRIAKWANAGG